MQLWISTEMVHFIHTRCLTAPPRPSNVWVKQK